MSTATDSPPAEPLGTPRRRWPRRLALVVLLLAGGLVGLWFGRATVIHPWALERAAALVRERWDAELSVATLESSLTRLRLTGVELRSEAPLGELGGLETATLEELEVEFSILALLRGELPHRVRAAGLVARLDAEALDLERGADPGERSSLLLPALELDRVEVTVVLGEERAVLREAGLALAAEDWSETATMLAGLHGRLSATLGPRTCALAGIQLDPPPQLSVEAAIADGRVVLTSAAGDWAGVALALERGEVGLVPLTVDCILTLDAPDLARLGPGLGPVLSDKTWAGNARARLELEGQWPSLAVRGTFDGEALVAADQPLGRVGIELDLRVPTQNILATTGSVDLHAGPLAAGTTRLEDLTASVLFEDDRVLVTEARAIQVGNSLELSDLSVPRSTVPKVWLAESSGRFRAALTDLPRALGEAASNEVPEHELVAAGVLGEGNARIESGTLTTPGGALTIESGVVSLTDDGAVIAELSAAVDFDDLAPLGAILDEAWAGEIHGRLEASGTMPQVSADLTLIGTDLVVRGVPLGSLEVDGRIDRHSFEARALTMRAGADDLSCTGSVFFDGPTFAGLRVSGSLRDASRYAPGLELGLGAIEVEAQLDGPLDGLTGAVELELVEWSGFGMELRRAVVAGRANAGTYSIERLEAELPEGLITVAGEVARNDAPGEGWDIALETASFSGPDAEFGLAGPGAITVSRAGALRTADVDFAGRSGMLSVSVQRSDDDLRAELLLDIDHTITIFDKLLPDKPRWDRALASMKLADDRLTIAALEVDGPEWGFDARGELPLPLGADPFAAPLEALLLGEGPLRLELGLDAGNLEALFDDLGARAEGDEQIAVGGVVVGVELGGTWRDLRGALEFQTRDLRLPAVEQDSQVTGRALLEANSLRFEQATVEVPERLVIAVEGGANLSTDATAWFADTRAELDRVDLDFHGKLDVQNLAWLAGLVPSFRRVDGALVGDLELTGPLARPEFRGTARLEGGELKLTSDIPALADLGVELEFDGRTMRIPSAHGELGGSPFALTGSVTLGSEQSSAAIDLHLTGENLLIHRDRDLVLRADADVKIEGLVDELTASGVLSLRQPRYTKPIELLDFTGESAPPTPGERGIRLFSFPDPPLADMRLDLRVETVEPVQVRNNLVRGSLRPDLRLEGTGRIPRILGTIYVDPTAIRLPATTVRLESGTVSFRASDPFMPELEVYGSATKFGHQVSILVTGPYDAPEVTLTSSPPLPREDIMLLLLTGQFPENALTADGSRATTQTFAVYLAEDLVAGWVDDGSIEEDEESIFESVEVVTGREVTRSGLPTTEVFLRLAKGVAFERDALKLSMELNEWEDYNLGLRFVVVLR